MTTISLSLYRYTSENLKFLSSTRLVLCLYFGHSSGDSAA